MLLKKVILSISIVLSFIFNPAILYAASLIPGGDSIGIQLDYPGVVITGGYKIEISGELINPLENGFKIGDIIISIDEQKVTDIKELTAYILNQEVKDNYDVTIVRNKKKLKRKLPITFKNGEFSTGLYVKDSISGIGTLTYYNPDTKSFGALGHAMSDTKLASKDLLQNGCILESKVTDINRATNFKAGNKIAYINNTKIGSINIHNQFGIYGTYNFDVSRRNVIETANQSEIKTGPAYFLTVLEGNKIERCDIEIIKLNQQDKATEKGIEFKVIDKSIIGLTNGIIQGMSGSPIIQSNKLIGCVTHVSGQDPIIGYGLYIEWMLEMDETR